MILILKLTVSAIKKNKFKKCQQDGGNNIQTKQNESHHQEFSSNKSKKIKKSEANQNHLSKPCG